MPRTEDIGEPMVNSGDRDPVAVARSAFLSGDVERAKRMADMAISTDPLRQDAWILKGRALVCRLDHAGAKECYKQALEIDEGNGEAWKRMAFAHRLNGEFEDAIGCWKKALELDPHDTRTLNDVASTLDEMGEFEQANVYYERTLEVIPDDPFASENIRLNRRILDRLAESKN